LEHQPAIKVVYTFILDTHRKYRAPYIIYMAGLACGKIAHRRRVKISPRIGAAKNG